MRNFSFFEYNIMFIKGNAYFKELQSRIKNDILGVNTVQSKTPFKYVPMSGFL